MLERISHPAGPNCLPVGSQLALNMSAKNAIIAIDWRAIPCFSLTGNSIIENREISFRNSHLCSGYQRNAAIWLGCATRDRNQVRRRGLTDVVCGGARRARHPRCLREASASACPWPPGEITLKAGRIEQAKFRPIACWSLPRCRKSWCQSPSTFGGVSNCAVDFQDASGAAPLEFPRPARFSNAAGFAGHRG